MRWRATLGVVLATALILAGFVFAYFGKEGWAQFTPSEVRAAERVFDSAPPNSLLIDGTGSYPTQFRNAERFTYVTLAAEPLPSMRKVLAHPVRVLSSWMTDPRFDRSVPDHHPIADRGGGRDGCATAGVTRTAGTPAARVGPVRGVGPQRRRDRAHHAGRYPGGGGIVRARLIIVGCAVVAWVVAATHLGGPVAVVVTASFLAAVPGLAMTWHLRLDDVAARALLVVASSLALATLVATGLLFVHRFSGTTTIAVLAILSVVAMMEPFRHRDRSVTHAVVAARPAAEDPTHAQEASEPRPVPVLDASTPALLVRFGRYPVYHGSVAAARSLGRAGVHVSAVVESRSTPLALSRYVDRSFVWPTTGRESDDELLAGLVRIGEQLETRVVAVPSDDEAAAFLAEHADTLRQWFLLPAVDPALPRQLASKRGLATLCLEHGVPTPTTRFPTEGRSVKALTRRMKFPVVVKNVDPFRRLVEGALPGTTVVPDANTLRTLLADLPDPTLVMVQEYLPAEECEDWIFHAYCDEASEPLVAFTGVKLRSWPAHAGVTTYARAVPNPELEELAATFLRKLGYRGIVDLDWRFDRRDGRYKLVDFNPRMGAQFAMFQTESGIDVVHAMHLDLTGRAVEPSPSPVGAGIRVGHLDAPARLAYRGGVATSPEGVEEGPRPRRAWLAADDLAPAGVTVVRVGGLAIGRVLTRLRPRRHRRAATPAATRGAAKSVPQTKRIKGPKVPADDRPAK